MKLLDLDDEKFTIAAEALILEPFKKLWVKNKDKNKASKELAYVFFMGDNGNELGFWQLVDEQERHKEVKTFLFGEASKWNPSADVLAALDFYKEQCRPYAAGLLEDAIAAMEKSREYLREVNWEATDKSGKFIYDIKKVTELTMKLPDMDESIEKLRRRVEEGEQIGQASKRGQHEVGMYENDDDDD